MAKSLIFLGVDLLTVDWYYVLYILVSIGILAGGFMKLNPIIMMKKNYLLVMKKELMNF